MKSCPHQRCEKLVERCNLKDPVSCTNSARWYSGEGKEKSSNMQYAVSSQWVHKSWVLSLKWKNKWPRLRQKTIMMSCIKNPGMMENEKLSAPEVWNIGRKMQSKRSCMSHKERPLVFRRRRMERSDIPTYKLLRACELEFVNREAKN